jgi:hypothetical protein
MKTVVRYLHNPAVAERPRYGVRQQHALQVRRRVAAAASDEATAGGEASGTAAQLASLGSLARHGVGLDGGRARRAVAPKAVEAASDAGSCGSERCALGRSLGDDCLPLELFLAEQGVGTGSLDGSVAGSSDGSAADGASRVQPRWRRRRERPTERAHRRILELGDARAGAPRQGAELQPPPALAASALRAASRTLDALAGRQRRRRPWPSSPAVSGRWYAAAERAALSELTRQQPAATAAQRARSAVSARPQGMQVLPWLDDFAFLRQGTFEEACKARDHVGSTFELLGLLRAPDKGQWEPSHFLEDHLGYGVDTERGLFLLTPRRVASLASAAHGLLQRAAANLRLVPARAVASFCGLGQASTLALPLGRFMLRSLYDDAAGRRSGQRLGAGLVSGDDCTVGSVLSLSHPPSYVSVHSPSPWLLGQPTTGWRGHARLSAQSLQDLRWWATLRGSRHIGRAIWRRPETRELWTDASDLGWGGTVDHRRLAPASVDSWALATAAAARSGSGSAAPAAAAHGAASSGSGAAAAAPTEAPVCSHAWAAPRTPAAGFWSPEELPMHITLKELIAVRRSVEWFLPELAGRRVLLHEDNQAVVWILTNMVTRSPELMRELRQLWALLDTHDISLRPVYIRSAANRIADFASRLAMRGDYVLARARFLALQQLWGECTVDAFASPATALLPRYWSESPIEGAEATDAFAQEWAGELAWAHPPPGLLLQLALFLEQTGAAAQVCAPHWPGAAWYSMLLDLSDEHVVLPPGSLERIAADAPPRLAAWPVVVFRVPGGRRVR